MTTMGEDIHSGLLPLKLRRRRAFTLAAQRRRAVIGLERNVVVEIAARRCDHAGSTVSCARGSCVIPVPPAVEEDQHPIVGCQMDLRAVPVRARLVCHLRVQILPSR